MLTPGNLVWLILFAPLLAAGAIWLFPRRRSGAMAQRLARGLACRAMESEHAISTLLSNWRGHLRQWNIADRQYFWNTMMLGWDKIQDHNTALCSTQFRPDSPSVEPFSINELRYMARAHVNWCTFIPPKMTAQGEDKS
jgi:hypothetical protein